MSRQRRNRSQIRLVAGGKDEGVRASEECCELLFQSSMTSVGAVGDSRTGRSRAFQPQCLYRGLDTVRVECQAQIVVGTGQNCRATIDYRFGRRNGFLQHDPKRITSCRLIRAIKLQQRLEAVHEVHRLSPRGSEIIRVSLISFKRSGGGRRVENSSLLNYRKSGCERRSGCELIRRRSFTQGFESRGYFPKDHTDPPHPPCPPPP